MAVRSGESSRNHAIYAFKSKNVDIENSMNEEVREGFIRQRRNLIIMSMVVLFSDVA